MDLNILVKDAQVSVSSKSYNVPVTLILARFAVNGGFQRFLNRIIKHVSLKTNWGERS